MNLLKWSFVLGLAAFPIAGFADLYRNDAETRREMTAEEKHLPGVQVLRDSGVLLSDSLVLTARHAILKRDSYAVHGSTYFADADGGRFYFKIDSVPEESADLDYAIARISWQGTAAPAGLGTVKELNLLEGYERGRTYRLDLFVLGNPWDRLPLPIRAGGDRFAVRVDEAGTQELLYFNAGVINGNSGGPIFDSQNRLLGIVLGGNHGLGDDASVDNDPTDAKAWNFGLPLRVLYPSSPILRELFPAREKP